MTNSPESSPRPIPRPGLGQQDKPSVDFGDIEFEMDLKRQGSMDPIFQVGFDPKKGKFRDMSYEQAAYVSSTQEEEGVSGALLDHVDPYMDTTGIKPDDVVMGDEAGASKEVWKHEYRHRGLAQLNMMALEDPAWFQRQYGRDAAAIALFATKDHDLHEKVAEIYEKPEVYQRDGMVSWTPSDRRGNKADRAAWQKVREGKGNFEDHPTYTVHNKEGLPITDIDLFRGLAGLEKAANDMLAKRKRELKGNKMAEGGMAKQMEFAFMEGGSKVDPVSGNEVPPGSMPHEVRDNIDMKISAGEYVVPADVVRYYGVGHFEKLREKAKTALQQMEEEGRLGDQQAASGGLAAFNRYLPKQYENPDWAGGSNNTGASEEEDRPKFKPFTFPGESYFAPPDISGQNREEKVYLGPNGDTMTILFINGIPQTPIPDGYVIQATDPNEPGEASDWKPQPRPTIFDNDMFGNEADSNESAKMYAEEREQDSNDRNGNPVVDNNMYDMSMDELMAVGNKTPNGKGWKAAGVLGGLLGMGAAGMLIGGVAYNAQIVNSVARQRAALAVAREKNLGTEEQYATMQAKIDDTIKNAPRAAQGMLNSGIMGTGEKMLERHRKAKAGMTNAPVVSTSDVKGYYDFGPGMDTPARSGPFSSDGKSGATKSALDTFTGSKNSTNKSGSSLGQQTKSAFGSVGGQKGDSNQGGSGGGGKSSQSTGGSGKSSTTGQSGGSGKSSAAGQSGGSGKSSAAGQGGGSGKSSAAGQGGGSGKGDASGQKGSGKK